MLALVGVTIALAQPALEAPGSGARLALERSPSAEGIAGVWLRCTWTERRSDGGFDARTCGGEGTLGWSWADGRWTVTVTNLTAEPACPEAAAIVRARWEGDADQGGIVGEVLHVPPEGVEGRAVDLLAELGDALQRVIVPLPAGKVRDGARWTVARREDASGLLAGIEQRWSAARTDGGVALSWTEAIELPQQVVAGRTIEPTVERWSGSLVHDPAALLGTGRWTAERPLRVRVGERWIETTASCAGELRPSP